MALHRGRFLYIIVLLLSATIYFYSTAAQSPLFGFLQPSDAELHQQKLKGIEAQMPKSKGYIVEFEEKGQEMQQPQNPVAGRWFRKAFSENENTIGQNAVSEAQETPIMASIHMAIGRQPEIAGEFRNVFNGIVLDISEEEAGKLKSVKGVKGVYPNYARKILLMDSVPQIQADKAWKLLDSFGRNLTGKGMKIGILDTGIDYYHPDFGACSPKSHTLNGNVQAFVLESPHPYNNSVTMVYNITVSGFSQIAVHFARIRVETFFDRVEVRNGRNETIAAYTGNMRDVWTPAANGDTVYVVLISDSVINDYGFSIDMVINGSVITAFDWMNCSKIKAGFDFVDNDKDPMDDHGHGTHVTAIAAGNGSLLKGVAPDAIIYPFKVCNSFGWCFDSDILRALDRSVDINGNGIPFEDESDFVDIVSLSLGGLGDPDDVLSRAIDNLVDMGVVATIAAGNEGSFGISSPGTSRNAITVGAIDKSNNIAGFSSRGPVVWEGRKNIIKPDVVAPGVKICAAKAQIISFFGPSSCIDESHIELSGTSMSAPHVAGVAALVKQRHPEWNSLQIKAAIKNRAVDLGADMHSQGYGRVDALRSAELNQSLPVTDFIFMPQAAMPQQNVNFDGFLSIDFDGKITKYEWDFDKDGVIDKTGQKASSSFPEGRHLIRLRTTDNSGSQAIETKMIMVSNDMPVADFILSPQLPKKGQKIKLDASRSYDPDGTIREYFWDLDNDGIYDQSGKTREITLPEGIRLITLRVTDNAGDVDTVKKAIKVLP